MEVYANGFPKAGNHALVKALQLLGVPCEVHHRPFSEGPPEGTHVFVKRDPRNVIVSWLRWQHHPVTPGMFLTAFRRFQDRSLVEEMADYEPWLADGAYVVCFEDLVGAEATLRELAEHVGAPYFEGAFEQLPGLTQTWSGQLSDYRTLWPKVRAAWRAEGGNGLLQRWGY